MLTSLCMLFITFAASATVEGTLCVPAGIRYIICLHNLSTIAEAVLFLYATLVFYPWVYSFRAMAPIKNLSYIQTRNFF